MDDRGSGRTQYPTPGRARSSRPVLVTCGCRNRLGQVRRRALLGRDLKRTKGASGSEGLTRRTRACFTRPMVFLLFIIVLVLVGGVLATGVGGLLGLGLFVHAGSLQKKAEANAPALLDAAFDGRNNVVFKVNLESLLYETVIVGAKERGYSLYSETSDTPTGSAKTLIFERVEKAHHL